MPQKNIPSENKSLALIKRPSVICLVSILLRRIYLCCVLTLSGCYFLKGHKPVAIDCQQMALTFTIKVLFAIELIHFPTFLEKIAKMNVNAIQCKENVFHVLFFYEGLCLLIHQSVTACFVTLRGEQILGHFTYQTWMVVSFLYWQKIKIKLALFEGLWIVLFNWWQTCM